LKKTNCAGVRTGTRPRSLCRQRKLSFAFGKPYDNCVYGCENQSLICASVSFPFVVSGVSCLV